jgi:hypothetical protein
LVDQESGRAVPFAHGSRHYPASQNTTCLEKQLARSLGGNRFAEQEPLSLLTTLLGERSLLVGTFDSLGNHSQPEPLAQAQQS